MTRSLAAIAILIVVALQASLPSAAGASKYKPCSLLTTAEIEAVLGRKVVRALEDDVTISKGPYTGETMSSCFWDTRSRIIGVSLAIFRGPRTPEERAAGPANIKKVPDELKQKGWSIETVNLSGALCSRAVPPASEREFSTRAQCFMERKGLGLALHVFSPKATAPQAKALMDKAVARLP